MEKITLQEGMENIAQSNFEIWNHALATKDPDVVAALYSEEVSFLPTLSSKFIKGGTEAKGYFQHFLEKSPIGEIVEERVQSLGDDAYLHSGKYNFTLGPDDQRQVVEARFTFAWKKDNQREWKIIHHHSSIMPKG